MPAILQGSPGQVLKQAVTCDDARSPIFQPRGSATPQPRTPAKPHDQPDATGLERDQSPTTPPRAPSYFVALAGKRSEPCACPGGLLQRSSSGGITEYPSRSSGPRCRASKEAAAVRRWQLAAIRPREHQPNTCRTYRPVRVSRQAKDDSNGRIRDSCFSCAATLDGIAIMLAGPALTRPSSPGCRAALLSGEAILRIMRRRCRWAGDRGPG
jgi:hypothetical protein